MKKILLLISIFIFSYGAALAQSASTGSPATNITQTTADVSGSVDAQSTGTYKCRFWYRVDGSGASWNKIAASPATVNGSGSQSESASLSSLTANTTYEYYMVLVTNDLSENYVTDGGKQTFTTLQDPTVTTGSASSIGKTSATLSGSGNAHNSGTYTGVIGYKKSSDVSYTYESTGTSVSGNSNVSFSKTITGLDAGTNYDFVAALYSGSTNVVEGSSVSFTTNAATAPGTVTTGTIENVTDNSADVNSNSVADDGGADLTSYGIYYGTSSPPSTKKEVGNTGFSSYPANFSTALTGGVSSTEYYIQAYATNSVGTTKGVERKVYTEPNAQSVFNSTFSGLDPNVGKLTLTYSSTVGNVVIIGKLDGTSFTMPEDGTDPSASATANTDWSSAPNWGGNSNVKYLYQGAAGDVTITGLDLTKDYVFYSFEYSGSGNSTATDYGINFWTGSHTSISTVDNEFPIELLSFTAENADNAVVINWATASEFDNDYFEIERSTDAENFEAIASVPGAGSSNEILNYSITDNDVLEGTVYYRLKQTDYNGAFTYSYILPVTIGGTNDIQISNVISKETSISFVYNNNNGGKTQMQLLDASGRIIKTQEVNGEGSQLIRMNMRGRSHGIYILHITLDDQTITKKVVF